MSQGFTNLPAVAQSANGRNFVLCDHLVYYAKNGRIFRVTDGSTTDGLSTPQPIWNLIPPFGKYWPAGILHDAGYRNTMEEHQPDGSWCKVTLSKDECDSIFLEAMKSLGVDLLTREAIYEGVHLGGEWSFDDDRRPKLKAFAHRERLRQQQQSGVVADK